MKRLAIFLIICTAFALHAKAQEAFYIYRNDGHFNGFFYEEVDSIVYSRFDLDNLQHDDYVVQEVHTADSIYRIPLSAIDSVGFVQPETRLRPEVRRIEELCIKYLKESTGMKLTFGSDIPSDVRPRRGEILAFLDYGNPLMEEGFIGRVSKVETNGGFVVVTCDSVSNLKEIFSQLIAVEDITTDKERGNRIKRNSEQIPEVTLFSFDKDFNLQEFSKEIGNAKFSAALNLHTDGGCRLRVVYKIDEEDEYYKATFTNTFNIGLAFEAKGEVETEKEKELLPLVKTYFPATFPVFECSSTLGVFFHAGLTAKFNAQIGGGQTTACSIEYRNGKYTGTASKVRIGSKWEPLFEANFCMEGEVHTGAMVENYFGTVKWIGAYAGFGLDIYAGPRISGSLNADLTDRKSVV